MPLRKTKVYSKYDKKKKKLKKRRRNSTTTFLILAFVGAFTIGFLGIPLALSLSHPAADPTPLDVLAKSIVQEAREKQQQQQQDPAKQQQQQPAKQQQQQQPAKEPEALESFPSDVLATSIVQEAQEQQRQQQQEPARQQQQPAKQQQQPAKEPEVLAPLPLTADGKVDHGDTKFLIYHHIDVDSQGAGQQMHGLLAAHLLGDEFGRVVCISNHYENFHFAFQAIDPLVLLHCPDILERHNKEPPNTDNESTLQLINYHTTPPDECALQKFLERPNQVMHFTGNTYPRWPRVPDHINFLKLYKPKKILLDILPYPNNEPPPIVVHLRHGDKGGSDVRKGVNDADLEALGELLPLDASQRSPFLVTNNVAWFDYFEQHYGWSHPYWQIVMHSALGFQWEGRLTKTPNANNLLEQKYSQLRKEIGVEKWETLQLWADWYTLLRAQKVYHTFSDFSLSAVHWMNAWSRTYDGLDHHGAPLLFQENWKIDGETPRLVDREGDTLRNCNPGKYRGF